MTTPTCTMQIGEFHALRTILYARTGIFLPDSRMRTVESRLTPRLAELDLDSFAQYATLLSIGPHQADELQELLDRITASESAFFQDLPQLEHFESVLVPSLVESRASAKRLRVWSAGCASGEEAYTLAIILHRSLGVRLADWHIEILGTDIGDRLIERAARAEYAPCAVRSVNPGTLARYFTEKGSGYTVDPTIRSMATFELHNLRNALTSRRLGLWDVIVCRNVLADFDPATRAQVVQTFHNQLTPGGCLLVGHHDITRECDGLLTPIGGPQAFTYTK